MTDAKNRYKQVNSHRHPGGSGKHRGPSGCAITAVALILGVMSFLWTLGWAVSQLD